MRKLTRKAREKQKRKDLLSENKIHREFRPAFPRTASTLALALPPASGLVGWPKCLSDLVDEPLQLGTRAPAEVCDRRGLRAHSKDLLADGHFFPIWVHALGKAQKRRQEHACFCDACLVAWPRVSRMLSAGCGSWDGHVVKRPHESTEPACNDLKLDFQLS